MNEDIDKEKKRQKQRWDESDHDNTSDDKPINDAMDHLNSIEGYPVSKPARLKSLPLPIRIIGYVVISFMSLGVLAFFILNVI